MGARLAVPRPWPWLPCPGRMQLELLQCTASPGIPWGKCCCLPLPCSLHPQRFWGRGSVGAVLCAAALPALPSSTLPLAFSCCMVAGRRNLHVEPASCCRKPWEEPWVLLLLCSKGSIPSWELVLPLTSSGAHHPPGARARLTLFLLLQRFEFVLSLSLPWQTVLGKRSTESYWFEGAATGWGVVQGQACRAVALLRRR